MEGWIVPPAIPAIVAAATAAAAGTPILGLSVAASAGLIGVASFALNTLATALAPKPKQQNFGQDASSRTQQVKQPITERRFIYGEARVSGPVAFIGTTNTAVPLNADIFGAPIPVQAAQDNRYLHIVILLATHEVESIDTIFFNDDAIYNDELNAITGAVESGKFAGKVRIRKVLGKDNQTVDPYLEAEFDEITSDFRLRGIAYVYVRLERDDSLFKSGLPNISAWVKGKKVYDPRSSTTKWQPNPALCLRDYLVNTRYGMSIASAKVPDVFVNSAANSCDEMVDVLEVKDTVAQVYVSNNTLLLSTEEYSLQTGDRVQATTDGTLPTGISAATNYYVIVDRHKAPIRIQLASSYANALAGTNIDITGAGSGTLTITKNAEPRYTANGSLNTSTTPRDIIADILTSMAGDLLPVGGKWVIKAGVWSSPTISLDMDDLHGPIDIQTKHSGRERFNAIQGIYVSPFNDSQPTDYPLVKDTSYVTEDGGRTVVAQFNLPLTTRAQTAQRIARIQLNRHRRQRTAQITTSMAGMQLQAGDTFSLTHTNHGWSGKNFEISEFVLAPRRVGRSIALTVDMVIHETDSAIYDFDEATEEIKPSAPLVAPIASPDDVVAPGAPTLTEQKYITTNGSGVKVKGIVTWASSTDQYLKAYQPEYKLTSDDEYNRLPITTNTTVEILDIEAGEYDVRVRAITVFDAYSEYVGGRFTVVGLTDLPTDVSNFSVVSVSNNALLAWDKATDIDVLVGGSVRIRYTPDTSSPNWTDAVDVGPSLPGEATQAVVALVSGTYLAKFVDSVQNESSNAALITVANAQIVNMNQIIVANQHPSFEGSKNDMVAVDDVLRLDGATLFDNASGDFEDAAGSFDQAGGDGQVTSGSYTFTYNGSFFLSDPNDIDGLVLNLDADDAASITDSGGYVSDWLDQTSYSNDFLQSSSGNKPITGVRTIGGKNAIHFNSSQPHYLEGGSPASLDFTPGTDEFSIISVVQVDTIGTVISKADSTKALRQYQQFVGNAGNAAAVIGGTDTASSTKSNETPVVLETYASTSDVNSYLNGSLIATGTPGTAISAADVLVGARRDNNLNGGAGFPMNGAIGQILIYNKVLNDAERAAVARYLADKWSLSVAYDNFIDIGAVQTCYIKANVSVTIYDSVNLFDLRSGNFDAAAGLFEGEDITGVDLKLFVRTTQDDPNGSPTWSQWNLFYAGDFSVRAFQFKIEVSSDDSIYQIDIDKLGITIDTPDITESGTTTTTASALKTVSFAKTYVQAPQVSVMINNAQSGDILDLSLAKITTGNFQVGVLNSSLYVERDITYFVRGH